MDLQGNPIPSGQRGVKNTTDPLSNRPINEPSGPVLKDSLAAESVSHGGSFNENRNAQPIGATSQNTTTNTTDTSAATKLPSASNAREREEPHGSQRYPDALGGQAEFPGAHVPETGYVGGSTAAKKDLGINKPVYPASEKIDHQGQSRTQAPASGSGYQTRSATAAQKKQNDSSATAGQGGEFPSDPKYNASFNSEIGSQDDPGRLAEQKFQRRQAETVAAAAAPAQKGTGDQTWYQPLNADQRA
ncbi:hypothetical protein AN0694.2 [Aspergillus nidulans FGSC A4]|uniref:Uncharacterized protein n=1 Tax=Emericella nidulans (strain FGSC A4 / ATCC 38163 / CBS 112.46 / NRRL 194 / M139) TaxID=227321 RepID=Q5BFI6_EMENI|nr:hypothetical protein [Aspergillus nidulans FGSC A4]EAA65470.1 hypothetical protein AN0694.2 [Aspergillus nidulans FGSC A4]CBF88970.1 TPA: conserved hypothetical protein [Aspergillus nidulans FGSC A4]|eukprot:XP_658298.1 hypothetical protein AN0694.2 [Aspergillus nidulans FGSC A4]